MSRTSIYLTLLVAFLLAGAASLLVATRLNQAEKKTPARSVVVAAKDLEVGTPLSAEVLKLTPWPGGTVPGGTFAKVEDAVGRAVLYPVFTDEVLLEPKLAPQGAGAGLPAVIPAGMRAVSIRVDDVVAVAGFVGPGTHVDVLLTGNGGGESLTKTILQDVQVLAAGEKIQPDSQGKAEKVNVVTLLCSEDDSAKVTLAANDGRIQLVLRNPLDKAESKGATIARNTLYSGAEAPKPVSHPAPVRAKAPPVVPPPAVAPPPPPPAPVVAEVPKPVIIRHTIVVIRGDRTATVDVEPTLKY